MKCTERKENQTTNKNEIKHRNNAKQRTVQTENYK